MSMISGNPIRRTYDLELGRTKQSEADACDIKKIWNKHVKRQQVDHLNWNQPRYGDFSEVTDYQGALDKLILADAAFMTLPSAIREDFENDPNQLLSFLDNPENHDACVEMGFLAPPAQAPPRTPQNPTGAVPAPKAEPPAESPTPPSPAPSPVAGGE